MNTAQVTPRGAERWIRGHPWIFRSEVLEEPEAPGLVAVRDTRGRFIGQALYSPRSEIRLRLLERTERTVDHGWWVDQVRACVGRRESIDATAQRLVHGEGDAIPSLIVDRYDRWLVIQILSAGLETMRDCIVAALVEVLEPEGILLRNDAPARRREGLNSEVAEAHGRVPREIVVQEGGSHYRAAPWDGQKTGAFLDQRPNRILAGQLMPEGGRALDCFAYHGSFSVHLARKASSVIAIDESREALERGAANAKLNDLSNIEWTEADTFERLRQLERAQERFDFIVLDPPAFAKSRATIAPALRGYREINLRAMRILSPGGRLLTASCSFHVQLPQFLSMLNEAAGDSGRRITLERVLGQGEDHPVVLTVPETGYLKGAVLKSIG
ncbi:MAG TPA: class I SAM-dependent rRNA methyltransferase [Gemmatimonadales bacterium]|nr:class I SAM-dependent rRNA methyltransferase [Gemmatimonadales bacterium]